MWRFRYSSRLPNETGQNQIEKRRNHRKLQRYFSTQVIHLFMLLDINQTGLYIRTQSVIFLWNETPFSDAIITTPFHPSAPCWGWLFLSWSPISPILKPHSWWSARLIWQQIFPPAFPDDTLPIYRATTAMHTQYVFQVILLFSTGDAFMVRQIRPVTWSSHIQTEDLHENCLCWGR